MSWFTENPWPLIILLAAACVVVLISMAGNGRLLAVGLLAAAVGVYFLEQWIVTPGEQLEVDMQSVLNGFIDRDEAAIRRYISDSAPELQLQAKQGLELVQLGDTFHMKDVEIQIDDSGTTARARLRANGPVTVKNGVSSFHVATRWETTWKRESTTWRLTEAKRMDLTSDKEVGTFSNQ